jgi:hypothetical protein
LGAPVTASNQAGARVLRAVRGLVAHNWKIVFYVVLIILCVLFAPEQPSKFIYTEF